MGDCTPPPPKWPFFIQKKGLKMLILGQKQFFYLGCHFKALQPIVQVPDSGRHVLQGLQAHNWVFQPPPKQMEILCTKKA